MSWELRQKLDRVAARIRSLRIWTGLSLCWLVWAAVGAVLLLGTARLGWRLPAPSPSWPAWATLLALAAFSAAACVLVVLVTGRDRRMVARRIEARHPELGSLLLTAVEQASLPRGTQLGYLQSAVIYDAVNHGRRHNWNQAVAVWKIRLAQLANLAGVAALVWVCVALAGRGVADASSGGPLLEFGMADTSFDVDVDPGNIELERGTSLLVVARFGRLVPPDATLVFAETGDDATDETAGDAADDANARNAVPGELQEARRGADDAAPAESGGRQVGGIAMIRSLDDPQFAGRVPTVRRNLAYHIAFDGRKSETYQVTVFDYPDLLRADAQLVYPGYTTLEPTTIEDVRQLTVVEGTQLTLKCRLNKHVVEARLVDAHGEEFVLTRHAGRGHIYSTSWTLATSQRLKLHLLDDEGRSNRFPPEFVVNVTPNRPPRIKIAQPARDVRVSALEELQLRATISDDFGIVRSGVSYSLGGDEPQDVLLSPEMQLTRQQELAHIIDFEALSAEPDQLVSYYLWAEDLGTDGQPRRTSSDMYFAEVRHFEEIFRQGEQPAGGAQQSQQEQQQEGEQNNSQAASELADLQKEIINATWKLVRREIGVRPTPEFVSDSQFIEESQQTALEQLSALEERVADSESAAHVAAAQNHMNEALRHLAAASGGPAVDSLRPALGAEQAAYQALLKLQAREFEVIQGNPQQGSGSGSAVGNRSQQQLQELELRADENRYETQSRATSSPEETRAQQQSRDILNRLRELSRRQDDLNERLKELQSALDKAEAERQREEIERELKRLRDQQQQILRGTDEMIGRMDQAENRQQMEEARQQAEQSRSHVQQASEALEEGQLSQAITEGTRAERQLSELRDEFRQQAASRFTEEMTELRDAARRLDEQQRQLSEQIRDNGSAARGLRDPGGRAEVQESLQDQRRQLGELLERIQETVGEAEQPEPLLSRQLYEAARDAHQQRIDDALDVAQRLMEVGIQQEAGQVMRTADQGIEQLRQGVDRAAASVLGDEAEALRRAQQEVERLADELGREIGEARRGDSSEQEGRTPAEEPAEQPGQGEGRGRPGQPSESPQPPEESGGQEEGQSPGEGQGSTGEPGARQNGPPAERAQGDNSQQPREGEAGAQSGEGQPGGGQGRNGRPGEEPPNESLPDGEDSPSSQGRTGQGGGGGAPNDDGADPNPGQGNNSESGTERGSSLRQGPAGGNRGGGGLERLLGGGGPDGPITGDDFRQWSDRMRDVEEMLDDPQLRSEAARIRDRAEQARAEFKRHSKEPDWTKLEELVAEPLNELGRRIAQEIRLRESPDALVPIDRDPVPPEYAEPVRRYYERLGSGK